MSTVRILQLTDLHVFSEPHTRLKNIPTRECLQDVADFIRNESIEFDHLVITGDHTHDEQTVSYQAVRDILCDWMDKLWQVPGNHDDRAILKHVFHDRTLNESTDRVNFEFSANGWLCLGLDTHVPGEVYGNIDEAQIEWIRARMQSHSNPPTILFMHHPPVILGSPWMDQIGLHGMDLLQQLICQTSQIQLVCCGHVHHESTNQIQACRVVTTPSTGIQFSPAGDTPNFVSGPPGFRIVEITDSGVHTFVKYLPKTKYEPVD